MTIINYSVSSLVTGFCSQVVKRMDCKYHIFRVVQLLLIFLVLTIYVFNNCRCTGCVCWHWM